MALNMKQATVIGIRPFSFDSKEGKKISMYQIFGTYEQSNMEGQACCACTVSEKRMGEDSLSVGDAFHVAFVEKKWQYVGLCG